MKRAKRVGCSHLLRWGAAALVAGLPLASVRAQDATWSTTPGSNDFNTTTNWTPNTVPTGTASFGASTTTSINVGGNGNTLGAFQFNSGAPAYSFTTSGGLSFLSFTGAGIVDNSSNAPTFNNNNFITFKNASTAADATFANTGGINFNNSSTAGTATFTANTGNIFFTNSSSAANASFTANTGNIIFQNSSTAANATIVNGGGMLFEDSSTAGNATITTSNGGFARFSTLSTGGQATFITNSGGIVDFSEITSGASTAGSIAGAGTYSLGANQLTVGGNNLSTTVSGVIADGGIGGGTGGSLVKVGTGTLTLSGANTYTGGTTISGGTLQLGSGGTTGSIMGGVTNNGTLAFNRSDSVTFAGAITGSGAVQQIGTGTTILTGTNTYTGGTTISGGTLQIGGGGVTGSIGGAVNVSSGSLIFAAADTGRITSITNGGTVAFMNDNSAGTGTTITNNDLLIFANGSTAGTAAITTNIGGATYFRNNSTAGNATLTVAGSQLVFQNASTAGSANIVVDALASLEFSNISTAGTATISGAGFMTFDGSSTAGNANITTGGGGSLLFTNTSSAGSATITVGSGQLVTLNASASGGSARFIINAGGSFDISGLSSGGTTAGSIEGAGSFTLGANALTVGGNNLSTTVSGVISGTGGSLIKVGSGTLILTGANSYTGGTSINAGGLDVSGGSLVSAVTVNNGGTLSGNGAIGGLSVASGGTVAPISSASTFIVNGNVSFASGSTYTPIITSLGASSKISATGTATLTGGTVNVVAGPGTFTAGTTYTILHATSVAGQFASVTSNLAFLMPTLSYDASDVFLILTGGGGGGGSSSAFASGARTGNQRAVGAALDRSYATASGDFASVLNVMLGLDTTQGPAALDAISGQQYAGLASANVASGAAFMNAIGGQMGFLHGPSGGNSGGTAAAGRIALTEACDFRASDACDADPQRWGAWMSAIGGLGSVPGNANGAGTMSYNFGGTAIGIDYRFDPRFLAGVSLGYGTGTQWTNGLSGTATSNAYNLSIYGSYTEGQVYIDGLAGYAYTDETLTRPIVIPGLNQRVAFGHTIANQLLGQVEAGYRFGIYAPAEAELIPFVRLQGSTSTQAGFTESGASSLDLVVQQQTTNSLVSTLGLDLAGKLDIGARDKLALKFRLGWAHENADTSRPVTAAFAGAPGQGFTVLGASPQRDSAVIGLAADTRIAESTSIYVRYDGLVGNGADNHVLSAGLRLTW